MRDTNQGEVSKKYSKRIKLYESKKLTRVPQSGVKLDVSRTEKGRSRVLGAFRWVWWASQRIVSSLSATQHYSELFSNVVFCSGNVMFATLLVWKQLPWNCNFDEHLKFTLDFHSKVLWSIEDEWKQMQWNFLGFSDDTWFFAADTW